MVNTKSTNLRVGLWESTIGVYFLPAHLEQLAGCILGPEDRLQLGLDDRTLYLTSENVAMDFERTACASIGGSSSFDVWPLIAQFPIHDDEMARCEITELVFNFSRNRNILFGTLPPDHLMPWPYLKQCKTFVKKDVAHREIRKRVESAQEHGIRFRLANVPGWAQELLTPAERVAIHQGGTI